MTGRFLAVAMCLGEALAAPAVRAQTVPAAVACGGARLGGAERAICASPELRRLDDSVDVLTRRLEASLTGEDRAALVATERPFVAQRNDCQNAGRDGRECVAGVLRGRARALGASLSRPDAIRAEISQYSFVDVPFFRRYGDRLIGRRISVFGCMLLAPGPTAAQRLHGTIRASCGQSGGPEVPVLFTRMDEASATSFFDARKPSAYWRGTVRRVGGEIVLGDLEP